MYKAFWVQMDLKDNTLVRSSSSNVEFSREWVQVEGKVTFSMIITDEEGMSITVTHEFYIINALNKYNCILGRMLIVAMIGIPSTHHQTSFFVGRNGRVERAKLNQQMGLII